MRLPPPDPHESYELPEDREPMPAPVAFYVHGTPSEETRRVSDALLDLRPGALVVFGS
jgi:hypothetical protein